MGRVPPDEVGFRSEKLQVWYDNTHTPWRDESLHMHEEGDACFIVLKGRLEVQVEDEHFIISEREFCCFPVGVYHAVTKVHTPAETLMIRAPTVDDKVYKS